jgi:hypothetical protein
MNKRLLKEQELNQATDAMEKMVLSVKSLSKSVERGIVTKAELQQEIDKLKKQGDRVKILSAEVKMFGEWVPMGETLPSSPMKNKLLILASLIVLLYLVRKQ